MSLNLDLQFSLLETAKELREIKDAPCLQQLSLGLSQNRLLDTAILRTETLDWPF